MNRVTLTEDLRELCRLVATPWSIEELSEDEHLRYDLYLEALSLAEPSDELHLIEIVLRDPDQAMRDGAMGVLVDRRASTLGSERFARWYDERHEQLAASPFAMERAEEWLVYSEVISGADVVPDRYLTGSDWLQRKLAVDAGSRAVLDELAARGRTKRVRAQAADRCREL